MNRLLSTFGRVPSLLGPTIATRKHSCCCRWPPASARVANARAPAFMPVMGAATPLLQSWSPSASLAASRAPHSAAASAYMAAGTMPSCSTILAWSQRTVGANWASALCEQPRRQKSGKSGGSLLRRDGWVKEWEKKPRVRFFGQSAMQVPAVEKRRTGRTGAAVASAVVELGDRAITRDDIVKDDDPTNNVPDTIFSKLGVKLHNRENHPLGILKNEIFNYFEKRFPGVFEKFDNLSPIVSVKANFDDVLVPEDHVSRLYNDTYYINSDTVLRCHTSAHQAEKLREGYTHFLVAGDVYRRDAIDATHYPVFHQMEGFRVYTQSEWEAAGMDGTSLAAKDLKETLEGLVEVLFGKVEMRWIDTYFPFTDPSYELEIFYQDKWLEVLGCGVTEQEILDKNGHRGTKAWAFGLGLERLAMVLYEVPDIRLFWSDDPRFTTQFKAGVLRSKFKSFSKFPPCYKDISFWISDKFSENNFCEVVRGIAGDLVEEVALIDEFTNTKKAKTSHCYRITYRSMERSLTDEEINDLQTNVREQVESKLKVTLR